jgi:hypothetical protein
MVPKLMVEIEGTQSEDDVPLVDHPIASEHFTEFNFYLDPAPYVEAGKQYEIKIDMLDGHHSQGLEIGAAFSDVYPGGEFSAWNGTDWITFSSIDLAFKTYVTPDTPPRSTS